MVAAAPPLLKRGGGEQNPAYRPTRPPLGRGFSAVSLRTGFGEFAQRGIELLTAALGQLGLPLIEQTVGEGVLAGRMRSFGLLNQMFAG